MSHHIVINTTTATTSSVVLNTGYLKSMPGVLKFGQTILGAVCVGIAAYYIDKNVHVQSRSPEFFFLLIATSCLIATFCLFLSSFASLSAGALLSKTTHEVIYHGTAFVLYTTASVRLIIEVMDREDDKNYYEPFLAASILGFIVTALYLLGTIVACRT